MSLDRGPLPARRIAVLDIGKTHSRLSVIDAASGAVTSNSETDNRSVPGPLCLQLDVQNMERWLQQALSEAPDRGMIDAIVPVAHGAAAVLLDQAGRVLAAPDYEDPRIEAGTPDYDSLRDPFSATYSPRLPQGLNLARQWHFLRAVSPELAAQVRAAVLYPQYWAWRLCGTQASEVTSLGCHTDLWQPAAGAFSPLARRLGFDRWLPPIRSAADTLGTVSPYWTEVCGLPAGCAVLCGLHDSNASYLCHLARADSREPFAVVSSGTWTIILARGSELSRLRESDDMLANVDVHGAPVPTARFMGGREYSALAGEAGLKATPTASAAEQLLEALVYALPSFAEAGGPYAGRSGRVVGDAPRDPVARASLATLYVALMTAHQLDALDARGKIIIDGPLATNALFAALLAALRPTQPITEARANAGAIEAARILCGFRPAAPPAPLGVADHRTTLWQRASAFEIDPLRLRDYAARWRAQL